MIKKKNSANIKATLLLLICCIFYSNAQENNINFPDDFFGNYKGTLAIHNSKGITNYPMEFHLQPTDSLGHYMYTLVYGDGESKQERLYTLKVVNAENGTYVVDENNGILLDDKVIENRMYSIFEVGEMLLTTFITFEKTEMLFEIVVTNITNKKRTGGIDKENIPEVFSYPISTVQRAVLKKQL